MRESFADFWMRYFLNIQKINAGEKNSNYLPIYTISI
jgi:hypothetical protein